MGSSLKVKPVAHIPNLVPPDIPQVCYRGSKMELEHFFLYLAVQLSPFFLFSLNC